MAVTRHAPTHLDHTTATVNVGSNLSISPSVKVYKALRTLECVKILNSADVDECSLFSTNGFCDQVCVNTYGSHHCDCFKGYQLFRSSFCIGTD